MRATRLLAGLALGLALGSRTLAQAPQNSYTVGVPEVEVRSNPGANCYPTAKLHLNDRVVLVRNKEGSFREEGGYLAIEPPPGSFSWINNRNIHREDKNLTAVVLTDQTPVRVGSSVTDGPPMIEQVKLSRGTFVVIIGRDHVPPEKDNPTGEKWWPIQPPPQEVRWIPKDAVKLTPAVETVAASSGSATNPPGSAWPTPGVATGAPQLWQDAEKARVGGDYPRAIQLYEQCAQQSGNTNPTLTNDCYNRIQFLREGRAGSVPANYRPGVAAEATSGNPARLVPQPVGTYPTGTQAPGQLVGQGQANYAPAPTPAASVQSSGPGTLRKAGFAIDGRVAYVLEDLQGRPRLYLTEGPNVNLAAWVNHTVDLTGPIVYRGDLRTHYMTVTAGQMLR